MCYNIVQSFVQKFSKLTKLLELCTKLSKQQEEEQQGSDHELPANAAANNLTF